MWAVEMDNRSMVEAALSRSSTDPWAKRQDSKCARDLAKSAAVLDLLEVAFKLLATSLGVHELNVAQAATTKGSSLVDVATQTQDEGHLQVGWYMHERTII